MAALPVVSSFDHPSIRASAANMALGNGRTRLVHRKPLGRLEDRIEVRALTTHRHREAVGVDHLADQAPKRRDASVETGMADFLARRKMQSLASKPNGIREANER